MLRILFDVSGYNWVDCSRVPVFDCSTVRLFECSSVRVFDWLTGWLLCCSITCWLLFYVGEKRGRGGNYEKEIGEVEEKGESRSKKIPKIFLC